MCYLKRLTEPFKTLKWLYSCSAFQIAVKVLIRRRRWKESKFPGQPRVSCHNMTRQDWWNQLSTRFLHPFPPFSKHFYGLFHFFHFSTSLVDGLLFLEKKSHVFERRSNHWGISGLHHWEQSHMDKNGWTVDILAAVSFSHVASRTVVAFRPNWPLHQTKGSCHWFAQETYKCFTGRSNDQKTNSTLTIVPSGEEEKHQSLQLPVIKTMKPYAEASSPNVEGGWALEQHTTSCFHSQLLIFTWKHSQMDSWHSRCGLFFSCCVSHSRSISSQLATASNERILSLVCSRNIQMLHWAKQRPENKLNTDHRSKWWGRKTSISAAASDKNHEAICWSLIPRHDPSQMSVI